MQLFLMLRSYGVKGNRKREGTLPASKRGGPGTPGQQKIKFWDFQQRSIKAEDSSAPAFADFGVASLTI